MKKIFILCAILTISSAAFAQMEKKNLRPEGAAETTPKSFTEFNNMGVRAVLTANDNKLAIEYFQKALELEPGCFVCKTNLGRSMLRLGKLDDAIMTFKELLEKVPGDAEVHASLGEALSNQGKFAESILHFEKALELGLKDSITYTNYAIALQNTDKLKKALVYLDKSLELDPNLPETHSNRGIVLFKMGKNKKALKSLNAANTLLPNNPHIMNNLGVVYDTLGKRKRARGFYENAVKTDPGFALAQYNLASNFLQTGEREQAYKKLNLLKSIDNTLATELQGMIWGKFVINASSRKIR